MSNAAFEYRMTGAGWSEATLTIGPVSTRLSASYLDDPLGDLVRGTLALAKGAQEVRVSWAEEPGEYRWVFRRDDHRLDISILWFDKLWGHQPDERGRVLVAGSIQAESFCAAIVSGAQAVLDEHGEQGYRDKWIEHDFPTAALVELRSLI